MVLRSATLVCVVLFAATLAAPKAKEGLALKMPPGWKMGNISKGADDMEIMEFVRDGEKIEDWKELVTVQSFRKPKALKTPEEMYDMLVKRREQECSGSTVWTIIEKSEKHVTYEWRAKPCLGQPEQTEIAKIMFGKNTCYILHYATKVPEIPADQRQAWLKWIGENNVTTNSP